MSGTVGATIRWLAIVLWLFLMTTAAAAQWKLDSEKVTDSPDRRSINGFGAHLLAVKDPRGFIEQWSKPQQPTIVPAEKIKAGEPLGILVLFTGCKEVSGSCDSEVDYTIYKPDGSLFAQRTRQALWKDAAPPKQNIQLGKAILVFQFKKGQQTGQYKIKAVVRDLLANTTLELETSIDLKE